MLKWDAVIVGLGKTGLSCVRYLTHQHKKIAVTDNRSNPPGLEELQKHFPDISYSIGNFDSKLLSSARELIVSPGIALKEPVIAKQISHGIPAIGDIELFARAVNAPIVAVTGTNGKSTVTTLVGEMAKNANLNVRVGGNLGTPALDLIDTTADLYVLELSSFQLETTYSLKPASATVLNIAQDHMDRYADINEYIMAKQRIFHHCQIPVINRDDRVSYCGVENPTAAISFGLNAPRANEFGLHVSQGKTYLAYGEKKLLAVDEMQIQGKHQWSNALAALALGKAVGLSMDVMIETLKKFPGLNHRCQWVAQIQDVDWYNDSKGTNVSSSVAAIEGLGSVIRGKLILIAGGLGKQQDFSPLRKSIIQYAKAVILIGQDAKQIATALQNSVTIIFAENLEEAIKLAQQQAQKNDAVLLSPACASFDMFKNFEHRGEVFMTEVKKLAENKRKHI